MENRIIMVVKGFSMIGICLSLIVDSSANSAAADVMSNDVVAIQALETRLIKANHEKDVSAVMRLYEPDTNVVIFDIVPPRQFLSKVNWQKNVAGYFASFDGPADLEIADLNITANGNLAYGYMIQHFSGKKKGSGNVDLSARVTDVYRKIGGRWFIVHEHVSVPVDIETGMADLNSKL
ncbi:nuclear transport factor 2 family protein [Gluconobacter frateurii]|uniref:YybH family protein n=1 Tax=Gluconobacter frateurii TaxID=38308 RepID=UPI001F06CD39|nr:nuclear transport factor 2 family protein [Gluconobacter frateurii]UMM07869.1 nuclear transport factor 2 family protein [Gluconobacter frateurii]